MGSNPKGHSIAAWHVYPFANPVVPLVLKICGRPEADRLGEEDFEHRAAACGLTPVSNGRSVFWRGKNSVVLAVDVGDFKLAEPSLHLPPARGRGGRLCLAS